MQKGERVILTLKPDKYAYILKNLAIVYLSLAITFTVIDLVLVLQKSQLISFWSLLLGTTAVAAVLFVLALVVVLKMWHGLTFWITNLRIVNRSGLIDYNIRSVAIESIADVVIHRGAFDSLFGIYDLFIPIAAYSTPNLYKHRSGQNYFPALRQKTALEVQKLLFDLKNAKGKGVEFAENPAV